MSNAAKKLKIVAVKTNVKKVTPLTTFTMTTNQLVLRHVFAYLGEPMRRAVLFVCKTWHANYKWVNPSKSYHDAARSKNIMFAKQLWDVSGPYMKRDDEFLHGTCRTGIFKHFERAITGRFCYFAVNDAFAISVAHGHVKIALYLLKNYCIDMGWDYHKAFLNACENGYCEVVKLMLADDILDPNQPDHLPLSCASKNGHVDVVDLLLSDDRIDTSLYGPYCDHALQLASYAGHLEVVKRLLMEQCVNPASPQNHTRYHGKSAIQMAIKGNRLLVFEHLLSDPRVRATTRCHTKLLFSATNSNLTMLDDALTELKELLDSNGVFGLAVKMWFKVVIKAAISGDRVAIIDRLWKDSSFRERVLGIDILHLAVKEGSLPIVDWLLRHTDVNPRQPPRVNLFFNSNDWTEEYDRLVKTAKIDKQYSIVKRLAQDDRVLPLKRQRVSLYKWVAKENRMEMFTAQLLADPHISASFENSFWLRKASEKGHSSLVKSLLKDVRFDPAAAEQYALRWSIRNGHEQVATCLLADPRVDPSEKQCGALRWAAEFCRTTVLKQLLLDARVDLNAKNGYALRVARQRNHMVVVDMLTRIADRQSNVVKQ